MDLFINLGLPSVLVIWLWSKMQATPGKLAMSARIVDADTGGAPTLKQLLIRYQYPDDGPLKPADFSGGEATVVPKLKSLGFDVVRIGEDWSQQEVDATVAAYFDVLLLEARQEGYNKSERNSALRQALNGRSKASVELKHQNVSAVLHDMDLPYIAGYKPRGNSQLLLRQSVQRYILNKSELVRSVVEAMEDVTAPGDRKFSAVVVDPPAIETVAQVKSLGPRARLPRKIDFAARDESNRRLGRAGEQWVLGFEQQRLLDSGQPELYERVDWVSERLGDGSYLVSQLRDLGCRSAAGRIEPVGAQSSCLWLSNGRPDCGSDRTGSDDELAIFDTFCYINCSGSRSRPPQASTHPSLNGAR